MQRVVPRDQKIEVLYDTDAIAAAVDRIAGQIAKDVGEDLVIIAILKGSCIFVADLLRRLHAHGVAPEVDFVHLSSYGAATRSSGQVTILRDISSSIEGRPVLLVDDILDTGRTLAFAKDLIAARGAKTVKTCVLLDKNRAAVEMRPDYAGFDCPDLFVLGYGMDVANCFRELPYIGQIITNE